jgi:hypothetical protein
MSESTMKSVPVAVALLYPALSVASGGDILLLLWLEAALLAAVVLSLAFSRLPWVPRLLLFALYMAAFAVPLYATKNMPYTANQVLINFVCIGAPTLVFFGGLILAMRWRKNITSRSSRSRAKTRAPA